MKIAYVSYNLIHTIANGGVGLKIRTAVRLWQAAGHEAHWFTTTSAKVNGEDVTSFRFDADKARVQREINRARQMTRMIEAVKAYQPDMIYLRSGIYTYPLQRLFRIAPVVMELNTVDMKEYRERGPLLFGLHRLSRTAIYARAAGFVAVSNEIGGHPSNTHFGIPILVLANGIDLRQFNALPAPANSVPRLAYMGVPGNDWQGLDKLFWLAEACPDFEFDLIGSAAEDFPGTVLPKNIHLHGFQLRQAYEPILAQADVAIGLMALHRKNMNENPTLKMREYLAYGIPVFYCHTDTDFDADAFDFLLELPNTEDNLRDNVDCIRDFVFSMQGKRVDREMIAPLIDQRKKENIRLDFMKQFAAGGK